MRVHRRVQDHEDVDAAVSEIVESDVNGEGRVNDAPAVLVLDHQGLQRLQDDLARLLDVRAVADGDRDLEQLVVAPAVEVAEFLGEQVGIGEGDERAVFVFHLRGLVTDALDDAPDAVAGDLVSDADAPRHQLYAVEEVVDQVLEGETHAGCQAGGDGRDGFCRHVEDREDDDQIAKPSQQRHQGVGEGQVDVGFLDRHGAFSLLLDDVAKLDQADRAFHDVDQVAEYEEQGDDQEDIIEG